MKMTTSPFPKNLTDDNFFNGQGAYVNAVVANAVSWGIPAAQVTALTAQRAIYEPLYHKCQDKNIRTRADIAAHRLARKTYQALLNSFHNSQIAYNDGILPEQKLWLGGRLADREPSPHPVITDVPYVKLKAIGGAEIEVRCRTERDRTMASMLKAASHVEYRYTMLEVGDIPPADTEDYPKKDVSSRAKFIVNLGTKNTGKRFFGVFRWVNMRKPKQEGPWSEAISVVIA